MTEFTPSFSTIVDCPACLEQVILSVSSDMSHDRFACVSCGLRAFDACIVELPSLYNAPMPGACSCDWDTDDTVCTICALRSGFFSQVGQYIKYHSVGGGCFEQDAPETVPAPACARCGGTFAFDDFTGNVECTNCHALKGSEKAHCAQCGHIRCSCGEDFRGFDSLEE